MNTTTQQTRAVAKRPAGELALSLRPECVVVPPYLFRKFASYT